METHACVSREQAMRRGGRATRRWGVPLGVLLTSLAVVALLPLEAANGAPPQYGWTHLGPDGGTVTALAVDPLTPATMYAGTTVGLFRSPDGGQSWTMVMVGYLGLLPVTALAIAPTNPTTVYVGSPSGVFKSTDGGVYWQPANQWLPNVPVLVFAIDPTTPTTLYAGTDGAGVFRSTDGAATWQPANSGLGATARVRALVLDPLTPTTLYAGTAQFSQTPSGIFKSTDGGASWQEASAGLSDATVTALALDPTTPTTLYAGTNGGVFKSTDGGTLWQPANPGLTLPPVTALALDPTTPSTLYAGSQIGVFRSLNAGGSWQPANSGMPPTAVNAFALLPTTPTTLYVGTAGGGIFKSTDGGPTWQPANSGLAILQIQALALDPTTPDTLYAGTYYGGVFKSTDGGGSWQPANSGLTYPSVTALALDPTTPPGTLYAGTYGGGVFKSTDGGGSWQPANSGLAILQIRALALDPTTPDTLYAGTYYGGVFKSTDGGGSWQPANSGLTYPSVTALALDPTTPPGTLYAGTYGGGVFKSTDGGGSWAAVNTGPINPYINTVILDPAKPTTLYAGSSTGVCRSQNAGATWQVINTGLAYPGVPTPLSVATLAVDPQTPGGLYAGTSGGGVFQYSPDPRAEILTPLDGSILSGASVTFTWSTGIGVTAYQLAVGTTPGGTEIYNVFQGVATSAMVSGLPTDGRTLYVRLTSMIGGIWQDPRDFTYTAVQETAAEMLTPPPTSTLPAPAVTFTWSPGTGATQYWLRVGTAVGAGDLFSGGTTATALPVTGLPEIDMTLYVRLESLIGTAWQWRDYTYTASGSRAALLTPSPNSVLSGASVAFTWSPGTGVTAYWLDVGTLPGRGDLYSASQGTATARIVSGLPLDGRPVFVRLWSYIGSAWQAPRDYTCTAADARASMLTPTPGTTFPGPAVTFTWSAGTGVTEYWLAVGASPGMGDLYSASQGAATSATVAGLPTDGRALFVRLESRVGGVWQTPRDYPYRAAYLTSMLTVRIAGSSDGSVRSTPSGIACTTECNGWFSAGTVVALTASSGAGGTFREWRGGCTGTAPSCMVTLGASLAVTAVFSKPFTDPSPKVGVTPIKAVHFMELREAINTLRIRYHLPAFTWSQTPPARGMLVTRTPLLDLRTALDQAYTAASRTHAAYTDSAVIAGTTPIRAVHLNELRTFVRNLE